MGSLEKLLGVMVAGVVVAVSACGTGETGTEEVGQVELTIVAVDSEGNTWKLPNGTNLYVQTGNLTDSLLLDGDVAVQSFSLPVGDYEWELYNLSVNGPQWPLERIDPQNNVEIVMATLVNPQPGAFTIASGATTDLTLQFDAAVGGSITFEKGTVDVTVEVDTSEVLGGTFIFSQVGQVNVATASPGTPADLVSRLPSVGSSTDLLVSGHITGPWAMESLDKVCASADFDAIGSGQDGVVDLLLECANGSVGRMCLSTSGFVEIYAFGTQAPSTPTFNDLGFANLSFGTLLVTQLPVVAFDGDTVDLSVLAGEYNVANSTTFQNVDDASSTSWSGVYAGEVYFNFAAAP